MNDETKGRLARAMEIVDAQMGEGASRDQPELVASVLQSLALEERAPAPTEPEEQDISWGRLILGSSVFLWWLILVVAGYQIDSSRARGLVGRAGNFFQPVHAQEIESAKPSASTPETSPRSEVVVRAYIDGKEVSSLTNTIANGIKAPAAAPALPPLTARSVLWALVVSLLCWTWPNLVFVASSASAFGSLLVKVRQSSEKARGEIAWSMVNGFFVVVFLGCSQIFLGDTVYKSLGISEALQIQIKQDRYLSLAFFASLLGLLLGVAQRRLAALPGNLPFIGFLFKSK